MFHMQSTYLLKLTVSLRLLYSLFISLALTIAAFAFLHESTFYVLF